MVGREQRRTLQNDNAIRSRDGRQSMRNDEAGQVTSSKDSVKGVVNLREGLVNKPCHILHDVVKTYLELAGRIQCRRCL